MDMRDGSIHQMSEAQIKELNKQRQDLFEKVEHVERRNMMQMTTVQIEATRGMPGRKARAYMSKQPCDCGSGCQARKCCFKKVR